MIESIYKLTQGNTKVIEKVILHDKIHYMHMIFAHGEGAPEHYSNGELYMTVIRGVLSLRLNNQENHRYSVGTVINIPIKTLMNVRNLDDEVLELILVKSMPNKV